PGIVRAFCRRTIFALRAWRGMVCDFLKRVKMASFRTLDDIGDIAGRRVLVRVDLNVPVKDGEVTDTTRIARVAGTIGELAGKGAKVILLAHFGRPKGEPNAEFSLGQIARATEDVLG